MLWIKIIFVMKKAYVLSNKVTQLNNIDSIAPAVRLNIPTCISLYMMMLQQRQ